MEVKRAQAVFGDFVFGGHGIRSPPPDEPLINSGIKQITTKKIIHYIGLDVHKDSITAAIATAVR